MSFYSIDPIRMDTVSAVTSSRGSNDPEIGTVCQVATEEYVYVYNAGTTQISPGMAAVVAHAATTYTCTVSSTTSADIVAGVCKHATLTTGTYGWLVRRGFVNCEMGADYSAASGSLIEISDNGVFDIASNTTGNKGNAIGKVLTAIASAGSGRCYIAV